MSNIGGKYFAPKPGRFGVIPEVLLAGGMIGSASMVSTTGTQTWNFATPFRKIRVLRFSAVTRVLAGLVSATATLPATIQKISASGATVTALTSSLDLQTLVSNTSKAFTMLTTLSEKDYVLQEGDILRVVISSSVTITTLPVELGIMAEVSIAE